MVRPMFFHKSHPPARRDSFEFKAWPPSVSGEGNGVWVAIVGLIVIAVMTAFGMDQMASADMKLTVNVVQDEPATPEKPPPR